ncbi:MAG TPA: antibiotic biosynthesis monooxygenase [Flavipsychrobacter sp.]|nr:antibiotic biosynthesis monooxygenase [Flavipsychrobacter sp.]
MIAQTPAPPYYAVIFTSIITKSDTGYEAMATEMLALAKQQPGFLGIESARNEIGITVSYWDSFEAIKAWKANERHLMAQQKGKTEWYKSYTTRVCRVERDYSL